ncbi:hypothetical protein IFR05_017038 [Cadophora sp. M221]|nr:hypothetical protein IFR05_017038 [Cadophora sp. M221]
MHEGPPEIVYDSLVIERQFEYPASPTWGPQPFQMFMGDMVELPYADIFDIFKPKTGLYDWQAWNSQVKFEPFKKWGERESSSLYPAQEGAFK